MRSAWKGQDEIATQGFVVQMFFLRGEQGRLGELVDAVHGLAERYPALAWRYVLAPVYAELGRQRDARRELDAPHARTSQTSRATGCGSWKIAILSEVVAFLDDARRAELLYQLIMPFADRCVVVDSGLCLGSAARPLGLLATTMGCFDAAARHFQHALEMNSKIRSPLWIAHTRHDYAQTLLRRAHPGDRETALTLLDRALATGDKLGLTALADRARRLKHRAEAAPSV